MRCTICSSEGGDRDPNELSLAELCKIVNDATLLGAKLISLSGGEPLESPHAIEFIRYVKSKGLQLHLYTCGNAESECGISAIDNEKLQILKTLAVDRIIFSIHGPNEEIHEKITTMKGSFKNLISSIERARNVGHIVELHFVPVLSNYRYLPQVVQLAASLGVAQVSILRFVPQGRGKNNRNELEITGEEVQELRNILIECYAQSPVSVRLGSPYNCFNPRSQTQCTAGKDKVVIRPDGFVFPCVSMKKIFASPLENDIRRYPLSKIILESPVFNLLRGCHKIIENSNCAKCNNFLNCKGGCITQRLLNSDNFREPYCVSTNNTGEKIKNSIGGASSTNGGVMSFEL